MAGPWRVRTRKPRGNVRINFGHPLARDIAFFYYNVVGGATGTFYDAVTGLQAGTSTGQTAGSSTDPGGGADANLFFDGAGTTRSTTTTAFANPRAIDTQQLTVFARWKATTLPAASVAIVSYGTASASRGAHVGYNTSGNVGGGAFTSAGLIQSLDAINHTGQWVSCGGSGDGTSSGTSKGWVNGVPQANSLGGANAGATVTNVYLGRDGTAYFSAATAELAVAVGWNRLLSDAEHAQLAKNPWQLLQPVNDNKFFSLPSGAVGSPTFSIAGSGVFSPVAASLVAIAGVGAFNPKAAAIFAISGNVTASLTASSTIGIVGVGATSFVSASVFGIAGVGTFSPVPLGTASFAITGAGAFTTVSASTLSIAGTGIFTPTVPSAATPFTMHGLATVSFIGSAFGWVPVTVAPTTWTPQLPGSTTWIRQ